MASERPLPNRAHWLGRGKETEETEEEAVEEAVEETRPPLYVLHSSTSCFNWPSIKPSHYHTITPVQSLLDHDSTPGQSITPVASPCPPRARPVPAPPPAFATRMDAL